MVAAGHDNGTVTVWNYQNKQIIREIKTHNNKIRALSFSMDGKYLAVGSYDSTINIYDVDKSFNLVKTFNHSNQVVSLKWHPEVPLLVSTSADNSAVIWMEK